MSGFSRIVDAIFNKKAVSQEALEQVDKLFGPYQFSKPGQKTKEDVEKEIFKPTQEQPYDPAAKYYMKSGPVPQKPGRIKKIKEGPGSGGDVKVTKDSPDITSTEPLSTGYEFPAKGYTIFYYYTHPDHKSYDTKKGIDTYVVQRGDIWVPPAPPNAGTETAPAEADYFASQVLDAVKNSQRIPEQYKRDPETGEMKIIQEAMSAKDIMFEKLRQVENKINTIYPDENYSMNYPDEKSRILRDRAHEAVLMKQAFLELPAIVIGDLRGITDDVLGYMLTSCPVAELDQFESQVIRAAVEHELG